MSENLQPEGSHVHWPLGLVGGDYSDDVSDSVHRMKGTKRGRSGSWEVRLPNDRFVSAFGATLDEMKAAGAV